MARASIPPSPADRRRLEAYERHATWPIFLAAILPIVLSIGERQSTVGNVVMVVAWIVFVVDLVVHIRLIDSYLRTGRGKFDLAVVFLTAPWFLIPGMGTSRFLVLARLARLARVVKAGEGGLVRLVQQIGKVLVVVLALVATCGWVVYRAESPTNEMFSSYGESIWWAFVTITTVGYGDIYPITTTGRTIAVLLMFAGLGVLGVLAGSLATFLGLADDHSTSTPDPAPVTTADSAAALETPLDTSALDRRLDELERSIRLVRAELARSTTSDVDAAVTAGDADGVATWGDVAAASPPPQ